MLELFRPADPSEAYRADKLARQLHASLTAMGLHHDNNETLAFARQLEFFYSKVYNREYPMLRGRQIVPTNSEVPPGAETHTFRIYDDLGEAAIVSDYSLDPPMIDAKADEYPQRIVSIANAFSISYQDLRRAAFTGIPIDAKKAETAQRIMDRKVDALICTGDSRFGPMGSFGLNSDVTVLNGAGVTGGTDLTGNWASATAAQIQSDVEVIVQKVISQTLGVHGTQDSPLTIVLPTTLYGILTTKRIDTFNMTTVWKYLTDTIPGIREIVDWGRLNTIGHLAGASTGGARIVAFAKAPDVVEVVIPVEFEMLPMIPKALAYTVPCHMRYGGVKWVYPKAAVYADGC